MTDMNHHDQPPGLVQRLSPQLTSKQRRHLRSLAHSLKPVVWVGHRGVTDNLVENVEAALLAHELIKIKVHDPDDMETVAEELFRRTHAQLAQVMGHILLFFRAHPEKPRIQLPPG